jgi:antitoxin VapB
MKQSDFARLFANGGSQAVRLPREFRFKGDRVRVRRTKEGVLLKPMFKHAGEWLFHLDSVRAEMLRPERKTPRKRAVGKAVRC